MWKLGKYSTEPFKGRVRFSRYTGLRKLARAMRRGVVPDERIVIIDMAMKKAASRMSHTTQ